MPNSMQGGVEPSGRAWGNTSQFGRRSHTMPYRESRPTDLEDFVRESIDKLDGWVEELAAPIMPPRKIEEQGVIRLELRQHKPHTVMIAKCVRAVSGLRASLVLAKLGHVAECGALLRIVSDFCTETTAIGRALNKSGELLRSVQDFVDQFFTPKPKTPDQLKVADRHRYVSRQQLMKEVERFLNENANVENEQSRPVLNFLNMTYDAYVHGAYETTMELYDPESGRFMMRGHPSPSKQQEFVKAVRDKLHEVVCALELTAAVTAQSEVRQAVRNLRHSMDNSAPWKSA